MSKLTMTVATVAITVASTFGAAPVAAQDVGAFFDKLVPRGKLIQKFRDEVNGGRPIISDPFSRDNTPTPVAAAEAAKRQAAKHPRPGTPNLAPPRTRPPVGNGMPVANANRRPSVNANAFAGANRAQPRGAASNPRPAVTGDAV